MSVCDEIKGCVSTPNDIKILLYKLKTEVDTLMKTTESKLLLHDGKLAELCKYLKDNLSNSIRCLLLDMEMSRKIRRNYW